MRLWSLRGREMDEYVYRRGEGLIGGGRRGPTNLTSIGLDVRV